MSPLEDYKTWPCGCSAFTDSDGVLDELDHSGCQEIARLRVEVERLTTDLTLLADKNEPEPHALHYDECPYKPFADLPRWDEPENPPECTCSVVHKAAYWKARWMLTAGWRQIAERERDEALDKLRYIDSICYLNSIKVSVSKLVEEAAKTQEALAQVAAVLDLYDHESVDAYIQKRARALLDRLQRAEAVVEAAKHVYRMRGHDHWDSQGTSGANCLACIRQREVYEPVAKALAAWEEGKA